jgi:hypothetical protein
MLDERDELRERIVARKHELLGRYNALKADSRPEAAAAARARLRSRLDQLEAHLKAGWANVNHEVRLKLSKWLEHSY